MLTSAGQRDDDVSLNAQAPNRLQQALRLEWLGQTAAALLWGTSVFVYGISAPGDWLQLGAATAWLVANLAALVRNPDQSG